MTNELTGTASGEGQAIANLERYIAAARGAFAGNTERALRADTAVFDLFRP